MPNVGDLTIKIKGDSKDLSKSIDKAKSKINGLSSGFKNVGKKMSMGLTTPLLGFGVAAIATAAKFEKGMKKVQAITASDTKAMKLLSDQAKELGASTRFSATEAADAMSFLGMAGFKTADIMTTLPGVLDLAAASGMDLAQTADIASNILTGFGKEASDLAHVNDVLAKAMTSANVDLSMMGEAMKFVGPVAASAGQSFEGTAAAIALMGNAGIQGSMAGTSLRGAMTRLLTPSTEAEAALRRLGIQATNSDGSLKSMTNIVEQLETSGISTADAMTIFGQRAGPAMMALVSQGSGALKEMEQSLIDSEGTTKQMADTMQEGLGGAMIEFKSAMEGLMIAFGEVLLPMLTKLVDKITPVIQGFSKLSPQMKTIILVIGGIVAIGGPLLIFIGMMIPAITALSGVFGLLSLSMLPITAVILGITAAIVAGILIWKNWDKIVEVFQETWTKVSTNVQDTFKKAWAWMMPGGSFSNAIKILELGWKIGWENMVLSVKRSINSIIDKINFLIRSLKKMKVAGFDPFGGLSEIGRLDISGNMQKLNQMKNQSTALSLGGSGVVPNAGQRATGILKSLHGWQGSPLPAFANGGIVNKPTLAMVGESGPEAIVPLGRGGGAGGVTININGPTYGFDDFEQKVGEAIKDGVRRGGYQGILQTG